MPALVPFWPWYLVGYWSYVWVCSPSVRTRFCRVPVYSERAWDPGKSSSFHCQRWVCLAPSCLPNHDHHDNNNEQLPFIEYLLCESSRNLTILSSRFQYYPILGKRKMTSRECLGQGHPTEWCHQDVPPNLYDWTRALHLCARQPQTPPAWVTLSEMLW